MEKEIDISRIFFELSRKRLEPTNYETDYSCGIILYFKIYQWHHWALLYVIMLNPESLSLTLCIALMETCCLIMTTDRPPHIQWLHLMEG